MKVISVDDEHLTISYLEDLLRQTEPDAAFLGFSDADDALAYLKNHSADVALLDIEMVPYSGLELAKRCKELCPALNIIFVTGHSQYAMDALRLHASGYLMKPVRAKDLRRELDNLRHPLPATQAPRVRIQAFGNFEVFVAEKPLSIPVAKCKETLAYLVDRRGASVTTAELAAVLWGDVAFDRRVQNNTHRVISDTIKYLKAAGCADILIKERRAIAIDTTQVDCDYFHFLLGDTSHINTFRGEYMTNYSWSEFTLSELFKARG